MRWDYMFRNGAPRNYNALRYEALARQCALATSQTSGAQAVDIADIFTSGTPVTTGVYDWNANFGGFSTDLPMNAFRYAQAGMDAAARKAVVDDWDDYLLGMFYFILDSGDSHIPASLVTALQGYGLDALHYCDPAVEGWYGLQDRIYTRDPIWQLNGTFKLTGADITNGQAGLRSTKTVGYSAYRYDQHDKRRVAYDDGSGMALWRQGVVGGANASLSIAAEAMQGPVTGAQFLYAPSFSKIFHSTRAWNLRLLVWASRRASMRALLSTEAFQCRA